MHIHQLGFLHRDLKPSNLLLAIEEAGGQQKIVLKIADFGQARLIPSSSKEPNFSLEVGTKWYKAPEILYGIRDYS